MAGSTTNTTPSAAVSAQGTTLGYGTAQAGPFTAILNVTSIDPPELAAGDIKVTNLNSPYDTAEYIPGVIEPGEMKIDYDSKSADISTLIGFQQARAQKWWQIQWADGTSSSTGSKIIFYGHISKMNPGKADVDKQIAGNLTVKVSSKVYFTAAT